MRVRTSALLRGCLVGLLGVGAIGIARTRGAVSSANRGYSAGHHILTIEGVNCGSPKSVDGGAAVGDVVIEKLGSNHTEHKKLGGLKYEQITLEVPFTGAKPLYDWITAAWTGNYQRHNGSLLDADFDMNVKAERQFTNALITETTFPLLDASSKEPAYLTVKLAPELVRSTPKAGKAPIDTAARQKQGLVSNFRVEIDGLDCSGVTKVASFTVKQFTTTDELGKMRDYQTEPASLHFPNLRILLAEARAQSWQSWQQDFLLAGHSTADKEKKGSIVLLGQDGKELARVNLIGLGIFRLAPSRVEAGSETIARLEADLYVQRMEFVPGK